MKEVEAEKESAVLESNLIKSRSFEGNQTQMVRSPINESPEKSQALLREIERDCSLSLTEEQVRQVFEGGASFNSVPNSFPISEVTSQLALGNTAEVHQT